MTPHIEIYRDAKKQWRFRVRASNGRVIATVSEGYKRRRDLDRALELTHEASAEPYRFGFSHFGEPPEEEPKVRIKGKWRYRNPKALRRARR